MVREHRSGPRFSERFDQYGPPLPASGIVARSRRGAIGESWWSGRFLAVLTELGVGGRLDRGKHYARAGQVTALTVAPGAITATVQGSRSEPYAVRIGLRTFADEAWEAILDALAADSWYAAALLAGEVPDDLEDVLARVGLSLFPQGSGELPMDCSCPDWSVPCKHLAAVAYLAAEEFDEDPFALLRWRGRDRATLLAALRERRDAGAAVPTALGDLLDRFHTPGAPVPVPEPGVPPPSDALLDELPPLVLADGTDVREVLRPLYRRLGEPPGGVER
jgi:uncharacterized Zn finger protein